MISLEDLKSLKEKAKLQMAVREKEFLAKIEIVMSTCGSTAGSREIMNAVIEELKVRNLNNVRVSQTGCPDLCYKEPLVTIIKPNQPKFIYGKVTPERVKKIISSHIINDQPIKEWLINLE